MKLLLCLLLAGCATSVEVAADELVAAPECSDERDPCAEVHGDGWVCCVSDGRCVVDDPVDCDGDEEEP